MEYLFKFCFLFVVSKTGGDYPSVVMMACLFMFRLGFTLLSII